MQEPVRPDHMIVSVLRGKSGLHGYHWLKAAPEHPFRIEGRSLGVKVGHGRVLHYLGVHLVPVFAVLVGDPRKNHDLAIFQFDALRKGGGFSGLHVIGNRFRN